MTTSLPARFQSVERSQWSDALPDMEEYIVAVSRVRCGMKDCSSLGGDLGRVLAYNAFGLSGLERQWQYQAPRGFVRCGDRQWHMSTRAAKLRNHALKLGRPIEPPRGRTAHAGRGDWDTSSPLRPYSMPGETFGLNDGLPIEIECPQCRRLTHLSFDDCERSQSSP